MNAFSPTGFSYDPFAKEVLENPTPYYRELLANHPGYYVEKYDMYVFSRYQDIVDVLGVTQDNSFVGSESTLPIVASTRRPFRSAALMNLLGNASWKLPIVRSSCAVCQVT